MVTLGPVAWILSPLLLNNVFLKVCPAGPASGDRTHDCSSFSGRLFAGVFHSWSPYRVCVFPFALRPLSSSWLSLSWPCSCPPCWSSLIAACTPGVSSCRRSVAPLPVPTHPLLMTFAALSFCRGGPSLGSVATPLARLLFICPIRYSCTGCTAPDDPVRNPIPRLE